MAYSHCDELIEVLTILQQIKTSKTKNWPPGSILAAVQLSDDRHYFTTLPQSVCSAPTKSKSTWQVPPVCAKSATLASLGIFSALLRIAIEIFPFLHILRGWHVWYSNLHQQSITCIAFCTQYTPRFKWLHKWLCSMATYEHLVKKMVTLSRQASHTSAQSSCEVWAPWLPLNVLGELADVAIAVSMH